MGGACNIAPLFLIGQIIVDLFIFVYLHIVIKIVQFIQTVQIVQYCQRGMDMITHAKIREKYKYVIKRFEEEGIISV